MPDLATLGWDDAWNAAFEQHRAARARARARLRAASRRVRRPDRGRRGPSPADRPRTRRDAASSAELPVVGDWVAVEPSGERGRSGHPRSAATADEVLPPGRARSRVGRDTRAGRGREHRRRLHRRFARRRPQPAALRALPHARAGRAAPGPSSSSRRRTSTRIPPARSPRCRRSPATSRSTRCRSGASQVSTPLDAYLAPGVTTALLGPSGAGKSTLVNALAGEDVMTTGAVRDDGSGRHTTTRRQLVILPGGALVVDNPGMRELQLWLAHDGLDEAFEDIVELETQCKFSDCRHEGEPGCAIQEALADGSARPRAVAELPRASAGARGARGTSRASRPLPRPASKAGRGSVVMAPRTPRAVGVRSTTRSLPRASRSG